MGSPYERGGPSGARLRWLIGLGILGLAAFLIVASPARAALGFKSLSSAFAVGGEVPSTLQAGSHFESWTTSLAVKASGPPGEELPDGALKDLRIELPAGLVGAPVLLPRCARSDFHANACPSAAAVGHFKIDVAQLAQPLEGPIYLLEPLPGTAGQLGLHAEEAPITIDLSIGSTPPFNLIAEIANASQAYGLLAATITLEGSPGGIPFLTLPRSCPGPLTTRFVATSWAAPQISTLAIAPQMQTVAGCALLAYAPELDVAPTTTAGAAPSGLDLDLRAPDPGIASASGHAAADTRSARLVLPPGMTVNPPAAAGLTGCTRSQLAGERPDADPSTGCPEAAKIGYARVVSPLFDKQIAGDIYVAEPDDSATSAPGAENPFDSLLAVYLVLRAPDRGLLLGLPIRIDADSTSGRLTASFDEIPELPLSHLALRFNPGPRAPLSTPPGCGAHAIGYSLTPSSGAPPLEREETFETRSECDRTFSPEMSAGTTPSAAGSAAPFVLDLRNGAGAPNLDGLRLTLPTGLGADLTAATECPEAAAVCPPDSRVGFASVALGSGSEPLWISGGGESESDVYLAGPYSGAPFSLLVSAPAVAGPFDLGRVILRAPVRIDPDTAQVSVELEGLPQIRDGIPLHYRVLRLVLDRPGFIRNPTSCEPTSIVGEVRSSDGAVAGVSDRFQVGNCQALRFRPVASARLLGPTGRSAHPRLRVVLRSRNGEANVRRASFVLPATQLLDIRSIRGICARVDFRADRCPRDSAYGYAKAWSPLLDRPVEGPVYLRDGERRLPDVAASLRGEVPLRLSGRLDSSHGRLRVAFERLPDIPLSKVVVTLGGGRRGVLVNTGGLCSGARRVVAKLRGHNGKGATLRPRLRSRCR